MLGKRLDLLIMSAISKTTTVHVSDFSSRGHWMTKPLEVWKDLKRLLTLILRPWDLSASERSKWKVKGVPEEGDLTSMYKNLPVRPRLFWRQLG